LRIAEVACGTTIVALGQVDPAEQEAFKNVNEKHYLVVSEANPVAVPPSETGPAILKETPALSPTAKAQRRQESPRIPFSPGWGRNIASYWSHMHTPIVEFEKFVA